MASRQVYLNELVTVDDMARKWHMSVGQVSNLVCGRNGGKKSHFPQPVKGKGTRAVWLRSDVDQWYEATLPQQELAERRASKKSRKANYVNQPLSA